MNVNKIILKKKRVIVVEDMGDNSILLCEELNERGYESQPYYDGKEAYEGIKNEIKQKNRIVFIIFDIGLPKMAGTELIASLYKEKEGFEMIPVFICSVITKRDLSAIHDCENIKGYYKKPINIPRMVDDIENCLKIDKKA
jgi:response regulator RpfG family c-di-GMP phosphodiesterase